MDTTELVEAIRSGHVDAETLVWRKGLERWARAATVPVLAREFVAATVDDSADPPPLPAQARVAASTNSQPAQASVRIRPSAQSVEPLSLPPQAIASPVSAVAAPEPAAAASVEAPVPKDQAPSGRQATQPASAHWQQYIEPKVRPPSGEQSGLDVPPPLPSARAISIIVLLVGCAIAMNLAHKAGGFETGTWIEVAAMMFVGAMVVLGTKAR